MGEEAGADVQMLTMLQFLRLILTIVLVPVAFSWMEGHAVGSAGGVALFRVSRDWAWVAVNPATRQPATVKRRSVVIGFVIRANSNGWVATTPE